MRAMDGSLPIGPVVDGDLYPWTVEEECVPGQVRDSASVGQLLRSSAG